MRDVVVFLLFVGVLPMCFLRPWVGVLAFSWLAYNRTQDLTWGFARTLPIAQLIAVAMILGWMVWEFTPIWRRDARIKAMVALFIVIGVSMFGNTLRLDNQWHRYTELGKIVFVSMLTCALIKDRTRLRQIALCISLALGFYGIKNGLWFLAGQGTIIGPGGMLKDNNDFALAMAMNLPFLWYLRGEARQVKKWGRLLAPMMLGTFFLTMIAIMSTGSRGGFLTMGVIIGVMLLKSRYKVPAIVMGVVLGVAGFALAPPEWKERMSTITLNVEEMDGSAQGRIVSWMVAGNMIKENPVLGIGFNNMVFDYHRYLGGVPLPRGEGAIPNRVAHNSYLQIWAESGTIAYILYMFMVLSTIWYCMKTARAAKERDQLWTLAYTHSIQVTLIGFLVGATFLNRAHFDLVYQLVAIAVAIPVAVAAEAARTARPRRLGVTVPDEVWVRHKDPFVRAPVS